MSDIQDRLRLVRDNFIPSKILQLKNNDHFDKVLYLTIPGDPVSDGRPRENRKLQIFYNQKKEYLRRIFREIYKMDPILQKLCIITPHRIEVKCFSRPTKQEIKYLSTEEIMNENVLSIANKDNDNVEKVNWDVLQDTEFMIILNDSYTVNNETFKYYSFEPRTEIKVYYSSTFTNLLYEQKILSSMEYKFYLCSKKFLIDKQKLSDDKIVEYLGLKLIEIKTSAKKKMNYLLSSYSATIIDGLFKYFFFDNSKNIFTDKYIKKKNKNYKIAMLVDAICASQAKRKEILRNITKDKTYQDLKKEIEGETLDVIV